MKAARRFTVLLGFGALLFCTVVIAQRSSGPPQPQAGRLPAISAPRPNRGTLVEKPASAMPVVPAGFTVSVYAELQAPRMMVYAPNGDLFVSSPAANNITVLRDANNDGVFEARGVYAAGTPPAARAGGPAPAPAGGQRGATPPPAAPPPQPVVVAPAYYDDWREQRWRERKWREREWREQKRREREWRRWHEDHDD